jgi:hypothetical protein
LDRKIALLGFALGVLILISVIFLGRGIGLALSVFLPCFLYVIFRIDGNRETDTLQNFFVKKSRIKTLHAVGAICAITLFLFSIFCLSYSRNIEYFFFVSIVSVIIAVEILVIPQNHSSIQQESIICQMLLVFASLSWGIFFEYPGLPQSDPWYHAALSQFIVDTGHVIPSTFTFPWADIQVAPAYAPFPFHHIIVAMTSILTGIESMKLSMTFSIGLFQIGSLIFIFLTARRILVDTRLALFAMFFVGISNWSITYGIFLVPQTLGYSLFALLFFLLVRNAEKPARSNFVLIFTISIAILLSHTVTTFVSLLVIVIFFASSYFYPIITKGSPSAKFRKKEISVSLVLLVLTTVFTYWTYFTGFMEERFESFMVAASEVALASPVSKSYFHYEFDQLGIYLMYFLVIVGGLLWLRIRKSSSVKFSIICSFAFLTLFMYSATILGLQTFVPERWFVFVFIMGAIPAAEGLNHLGKILRRRQLLVIMCVFIFSLTFLMVATGDANLDSPLIGKNEVPSYSYTLSEMTAAKTVTSFANSTVYSDADMGSYFWWVLQKKIAYCNFTNPTVMPNGAIVLLRQYVFEHPIQIAPYGSYIIANSTFTSSFQYNNRIYSNGQVEAYTR